jgi:uncharacterized damage-inducible protein DinB
MDAKRNTLQFKITLAEVEPAVWRRIEVPAKYSFRAGSLSAYPLGTTPIADARDGIAASEATMNPADSQTSIIARFADGPAQLEQALAGLQDADLDAPPAQGGWTIRQIVHHIVDGDDLWKLCIKAALGNEQGEFTLEWYWLVPQDIWADRWAYAERPIDVSLALFKATRAHVTELLAHVPDGWSRSIAVRKPTETTRLTVGAVVQMQADHLQHHLHRIVALRQEGGGA